MGLCGSQFSGAGKKRQPRATCLSPFGAKTIGYQRLLSVDLGPIEPTLFEAAHRLVLERGTTFNHPFATTWQTWSVAGFAPRLSASSARCAGGVGEGRSHHLDARGLVSMMRRQPFWRYVLRHAMPRRGKGDAGSLRTDLWPIDPYFAPCDRSPAASILVLRHPIDRRLIHSYFTPSILILSCRLIYGSSTLILVHRSIYGSSILISRHLFLFLIIY